MARTGALRALLQDAGEVRMHMHAPGGPQRLLGTLPPAPSAAAASLCLCLLSNAAPLLPLLVQAPQSAACLWMLAVPAPRQQARLSSSSSTGAARPNSGPAAPPLASFVLWLWCCSSSPPWCTGCTAAAACPAAISCWMIRPTVRTGPVSSVSLAGWLAGMFGFGWPCAAMRWPTGWHRLIRMV